MDAYCGARRDISRDELELRCCATGRVIHGTDTIGKVRATCALLPFSLLCAAHAASGLAARSDAVCLRQQLNLVSDARLEACMVPSTQLLALHT